MTCEDITMEKVYMDCDLLTGKNTDGIKYVFCSECYRYDICKKAFEEDYGVKVDEL